MSHSHLQVRIFINRVPYLFEKPESTGRVLKGRAKIPLKHELFVESGHRHEHVECGCERKDRGDKLLLIADDKAVTLENGEHFWSIAPASVGETVKINRKEYTFAEPHQTGHSLKARAGIPLTDVLFLDRPQEDEVIPNDKKVTLHCDQCFHSEPPANYGNPIDAVSVGFAQFELLKQPDGWTYLVVHDYPIPDGYAPNVSRLLVKLPPLFPDAAPDMFWLNPHVRTSSGAMPQGTSVEAVLDSQWQRFSWHLQPGAWLPGISTLRDFMRCVRARIEKRN
jgi:hypothetical protein